MKAMEWEKQLVNRYEESGGMCRIRPLRDQDHGTSRDLYKHHSSQLHLILTRLGERCTVNDCTEMIRSVDADGDGFVSFDEFRKMMTRN
ncbi:UNVERIFIED_CONTAM: Calcium-binding allergen Ole e 8 [Sesamum angustifolium]|uniref:Calcium-binding allergen Ole e 8 n=1 Tax=Sesamum angustifolium TaxID=2727405 RepID=A0AAW2RJH3_9LAMI